MADRTQPGRDASTVTAPTARVSRHRAPREGSRRVTALASGLLSATVLGGCADTGMARLTADDFAAVEGMPVHFAGDPVEGPAEPLGDVEGVSCNDTGYDESHPRGKPVSRFEALFRLRMAAAGRDADRVAEVACERLEGNTFSECRESVVCAGVAMRDVAEAPATGAAQTSAPAAEPLEAARVDGEPLASAGIVGGEGEGEGEDEFLVPLGFTPDYLTESQRASLGALAVGVPLGAPGTTVEAPLTAKQAAAWGAGKWFLNCIGQGGYIGLIISPACALIGATVGAGSGTDPEVIEANGEAIVRALEEFYVHEALRDEVVRVARAETDAEFEVLGAGAAAARETFDTVLEIGVDELLLPTQSEGAVANLPTAITVRARARVVRRGDGTVLYDRAYGFTTEPRQFAGWGANDGAAVRYELGVGYRDLAERIVDDVLLAYPVMPVFGAASGIGRERRYLIEPLAPERHGYDFDGRAWPTAAGSFEPTLRWTPFPSEPVLDADFQERLAGLEDVSYDLRLYRVERRRRGSRLVLEKRSLPEPAFTPDQPLAPDSLYIWTVRARFRLDGAERTTRWTGDWLGGGVKGFVFYTPR